MIAAPQDLKYHVKEREEDGGSGALLKAMKRRLLVKHSYFIDFNFYI